METTFSLLALKQQESIKKESRTRLQLEVKDNDAWKEAFLLKGTAAFKHSSKSVATQHE